MLTADEWHNKHHRLAHNRLPEISTCRRCVVAKAKCAGKVIFKTRELADKKAIQLNVERCWWPGECMKPYRCRYCDNWHHTTATTQTDIERVEKMRKKWMRKTKQKDYDNYDYGWASNNVPRDTEDYDSEPRSQQQQGGDRPEHSQR